MTTLVSSALGPLDARPPASTDGTGAATWSVQAQRTELILRQLTALPTLPALAVRLLGLTTSDRSDSAEVVRLIRSDPALTARLLSMCRKADVGVREEVTTVDRAVKLLGFKTVRNAVLSMSVFDAFDAGPGQPDADPAAARGLDRAGLWRHCLAVAIAASELSQSPRSPSPATTAAAVTGGTASAAAATPQPEDAFVCGLLHDIGKLALAHVLPKAYARVVELAVHTHANIADCERRVLGIDHLTAGKKIAEHWQLPHLLQDCIWLHGMDPDRLPDLPHRRMIGLVTLADALARAQHIGFSGNFALHADPRSLAVALGLDPDAPQRVTDHLHEHLRQHAVMLGLDDEPSDRLFLQSIQKANHELGRVLQLSEQRGRRAQRQARLLQAIEAFNLRSRPGRSVQDVLGDVAASAASVLGPGFYAALYQSAQGQPWLLCRYDRSGREAASQLLDPPAYCPDIAAFDADAAASLGPMSVLSWVADHLVEADDLRRLTLLPLGCGWGTVALLLHDRGTTPALQEFAPLLTTWGCAVAAAGQHDGARRLGEQLAQAHRALQEAQDELLKARSMARLGEMAAGAAHEMNNPLTVISGRSQLLAHALPEDSPDRKAAQSIADAAHRLSDLISALRGFADPPRARPESTDIGALLDRVVRGWHQGLPHRQQDLPFSVRVMCDVPPCRVDPGMIDAAVRELLLNAVQSGPRSSVDVSARIEPAERTLILEVRDDGCGMDAHTLAHATDPFFSAKAAGRRLGLGLTRVAQWTQAHAGRLDLRSQPDRGTTATLLLPLD